MQHMNPFCNIYMWSVSLKRHVRSEDILLKQPFLSANTQTGESILYWMCYMGAVVFLSIWIMWPDSLELRVFGVNCGIEVLGLLFVIASGIGVLEYNSCQALWPSIQ